MLLRPFVISYRAARKVFAPLARDCGVRIKGLASAASTASTQIPAAAASAPAKPLDTEYASILAMLEETARLGHVPADALSGRLYACHCGSLAQDRQALVTLEQELEGHLARLDARFPVPRPEPDKPEPVRVRRFGPISRDLRATAPGTDTRQ